MQEQTVVSIRMATVSDAAVLADLGRQTFHETFAAQNKPEDMDAYIKKSFTLEQLTAELSEPGAVYILAQARHNVIGFANIAPTLCPACITVPNPTRLMKLYVLAKAIGSGVGSALMRATIEWARESHYQSLWLGVWEHNHRARAFYARWGFEPVGTEIFRLGSDDQTDLLMQLQLTSRSPE